MRDTTNHSTNRFFRMLLRLLPGEFRGDFGPEMEQVFAEQRAEAARTGDKMGIWRLWWETAKGIFTTAPREHLSMLRQDSAFALRMMGKNFGFTVAAIVVLGLGIGANTAIFSVVNAVLLKPLPYEHGERLILLRQGTSRAGQLGRNVSVPELMDYRRQNRSLDALVEYHNMQFTLLGRSEPERVETGVVSWNFFDVLGVKPLAGRMFEPDDEKPGAPPVLLLSYEYWLRSFGGDPTVVGKTFRMNDKVHAVIGVLPPFPRRDRELGIRAAMGAGRVRLFRQLLTESFLLALGGGALGLFLASGGVQLLVAYVARFTPRANEVHIDSAVLLFTLGVALFVTVLTGTAPALARRDSLVTTLKEGGNQTTPGAARGKMRSALIVAQVAVSFLLLIGAGLTVRSLINLQRVDAGFRPENVLTVQLSLDFTKDMSNRSMLAFSDSLLAKVQSMPQVTSVAMSEEVPLDKQPALNNEFLIEGRQGDSVDAKPTAEFNVATPDYFQTLGVPILGGRTFDGRDRPDKPQVAIINQSLARHRWPGQDPLGRRISFDGGQTWTQIVGIVGDVRERGLDQAPADLIYLPYAQYPQMGPSLVARTQGDPMNIARAVVLHLYEVDPNQPAGRIQSLEQVRADSIAAPRLTADLLGLFALLALAIAAAGIGGVMALSVSQRTHEIGVRMAIGARPAEIVLMILKHGMSLAITGVVLGVLVAFALTHAVSTFLFGVTPTDPITFVGVAAVLSAAAFTACYLPARRAAKVDPLRALRTE